jgi:hypothetical protein
MKTYTFTAKLLKATRRNSSIYGNPAWTLKLEYDNDIIEAKTASDAACGYSVSNYRTDDIIQIKGHYTKSGNFIVDYIID